MAKENQKASGNSINRTKKSGSGKIANTTINTRREAAKSAGVGERTYDAGKLILDAAELWIIRNQLARRNLHEIDRIALERREEELMRPLAKESKSEKVAESNRRRVGKSSVGKIANTEPVHTRREAAKSAGGKKP